MSESDHPNHLPPARKKRGAVFIVIVISIAVHLLAGGVLAVIKITEVLKKEADFEAPPLEAVKPPPPPPPPPPTTSRTQKSMPRPQPLAAQNPLSLDVPTIEIDRSNLNMLSGRGFGGGLGSIGGGVLDTANFNITSFGFDKAVEGTLTGKLFDFKQTRNGDPIPNTSVSKVSSEFVKNFRLKDLERDFFSVDKELYASYFIIPSTSADVAPKAFGAEGIIEPKRLGAAYTGRYTPAVSGRFRFMGRGDDVIIVRVNGKIVLDGSWNTSYSSWRQSPEAAQADSGRNYNRLFGMGPKVITGDWVNFTAGQAVDLDVFVAEVPGGSFGAYLLIEAEGGKKPVIFSTIPLRNEDRKFLRGLHPHVADFLP